MKFRLWKSFHWVSILLIITFFSHGTYYSFMNYKEDLFLENKVKNVVTENEEDILLSLLQLAYNLPSHKTKGKPSRYKIVNPILKILGPSPIQIAKNGGHCGRRSRLLISLLRKRKIKARKVHLINHNYKEYKHSHEYVHAVVEVYVNNKWVVADPLYNLVYRNEIDNLVGLDEIRSNQKIFVEGLRRAERKYVDYYEELYTYSEYRKFLWKCLPFGNLLYNYLTKIFGKNLIDNISTPYLFEKPYLCLATISYLLCFILLLQIIHLYGYGAYKKDLKNLFYRINANRAKFD